MALAWVKFRSGQWEGFTAKLWETFLVNPPGSASFVIDATDIYVPGAEAEQVVE